MPGNESLEMQELRRELFALRHLAGRLLEHMIEVGNYFERRNAFLSYVAAQRHGGNPYQGELASAREYGESSAHRQEN
jgi:hypothetical protein